MNVLLKELENGRFRIHYSSRKINRPVIVVETDSDLASRSDGASQMGVVVSVRDMDDLDYNAVMVCESNKSKRVSVSSCSAEVQACTKGLDRALWIQQLINDMTLQLLPIVMATDCKDVHGFVHSLSNTCTEKSILRDIYRLREALSVGDIRSFVHVSGSANPAHALTKKGKRWRSNTFAKLQDMMTGVAPKGWSIGATRLENGPRRRSNKKKVGRLGVDRRDW